MYLSSVSNISLVKDMTSNLLGQQRTLHLLSNQLSTGVKSNNLTDYSPTEAKRLLSLSAALSQRDAYLFSINSARDNMSFYEVTLTQISKILDLAISFSSNNNVYSAYTANTIATQATGYLDSLTAL
ncbi:MAG: hypothetical protein FWF23_02810, partial [Alphaproteobacteria bacterium]|nr:hypothetical protein [Alphaproteobacteria bacterium]